MKALTLALAVSVAALAQTAPYPVTQGKTYKFEKIADGVYYATGGSGSNNVVVINDNDVLLVDDGTSPAAARAFVADVKMLTNKPIRYVVNTHFHYDHTDGNQIFGPEVSIIGHEYVRTAITTFDVLHREPFQTSQLTSVPARIESTKQQIAAEKDPAKKAALQKRLAADQRGWEDLKEIRPTPPNVTYETKLALYKGQREIDLLHLGRGHTAGDTVVFLPKEHIVCTGDLMESRISYMGDAYFDEWITTLEALKKLDFTVDLPGHGVPFTDKGLITAFQGYLTDLIKQGTALRKQGVSADDAAKRMDLTSHNNEYFGIRGPGADVRGVRRLYAWLAEKEAGKVN